MILLKSKPLMQTERPLIRIYSERNIQKFTSSLARTDMSAIGLSTDINEAFDKFHHIITKCFNDNFPFVKLSRKRQRD